MMKKKVLTVLMVGLLAGCSSPPKPKAVPWKQAAQNSNRTLPVWHENHTVIPAKPSGDPWMYQLNDFNGHAGDYPLAFYYGIANARHILIRARRSEDFLKTKAWLIAQGASAPIAYQFKAHCIICHTVDIAFFSDARLRKAAIDRRVIKMRAAMRVTQAKPTPVVKGAPRVKVPSTSLQGVTLMPSPRGSIDTKHRHSMTYKGPL